MVRIPIELTYNENFLCEIILCDVYIEKYLRKSFRCIGPLQSGDAALSSVVALCTTLNTCLLITDAGTAAATVRGACSKCSIPL